MRGQNAPRVNLIGRQVGVQLARIFPPCLVLRLSRDIIGKKSPERVLKLRKELVDRFKVVQSHPCIITASLTEGLNPFAYKLVSD